MVVEKKKIPFQMGMWVTKPQGEVRLLGSQCLSCGEVVFPRREHGYCLHCQKKTVKDKELSSIGTIVAVTEVIQPPAGGYYRGPVPYFFGLVDLDDGVRVESHLDGDASKLINGERVKLDIKTLYEDEDGNEVQAYTYRPV